MVTDSGGSPLTPTLSPACSARLIKPLPVASRTVTQVSALALKCSRSVPAAIAGADAAGAAAGACSATAALADSSTGAACSTLACAAGDTLSRTTAPGADSSLAGAGAPSWIGNVGNNHSATAPSSRATTPITSGRDRLPVSTATGRSLLRRNGSLMGGAGWRHPGADTGMRSSTGAGSVPKARQMAEASARAKVTSGSWSRRSFSSASSFCGDTFMALASSAGSTPADSRSARSICPAERGPASVTGVSCRLAGAVRGSVIKRSAFVGQQLARLREAPAQLSGQLFHGLAIVQAALHPDTQPQ